MAICAACDFDDAEHDIGQVTISIGLHFFDDGKVDDLATSFRLADKALYDAKSSGRNRISFSVPHQRERIAA